RSEQRSANGCLPVMVIIPSDSGLFELGVKFLFGLLVSEPSKTAFRCRAIRKSQFWLCTTKQLAVGGVVLFAVTSRARPASC
ncbi:hypothetical protein, partial [Silvimonas sp.]|uniref:hypothetical protein n=1 Tax=Silvimonas sp. TaxID=2650811 RepID=UPI00284587EC